MMKSYLAIDSSRNYHWIKIIISILVLFSILYLLPKNLLSVDMPQSYITNHSKRAIVYAFNEEICGKKSMISEKYDQKLQDVIDVDNNMIWNQPVKRLSQLAINGLSSKEYCESVNLLSQDIENSISWVYGVILKVSPAITFQELAQSLQLLRIMAIGISLIIGYQLGFSLLMLGYAGIVMLIANYSLTKGLPFENYTFLFSVTILYISVISFAIFNQLYKKYISTLLFSILIGLFAALFLNLRTSYAPLIYIGFFLYIFFGYINLKKSSSKKRKLGLILLPIILFSVSFSYMHSELLSKYNPEKEPSFIYHPVAHMLVLGLANNNNELSKREGITWNDDVGFDIAKRNDPSVTQASGPNYEKALFSYYFSLWKNNTQEMTIIYLNRLYVTFQSLISQASKHLFSSNSYISSWIPEPLATVPTTHIIFAILVSLLGFIGFVCLIRQNKFTKAHLSLLSVPIAITLFSGKIYLGGIFYNMLFLSIIIVACKKFDKWNFGIISFMILLSLSSLMLLSESTLVMPYFAPYYFMLFLVNIMLVFGFYSETVLKIIFSNRKLKQV